MAWNNLWTLNLLKWIPYNSPAVSPLNQKLQSQEYRKWIPTRRALDCLTDFPNQCHRKFIEKIKENVNKQNDIGVYRINLKQHGLTFTTPSNPGIILTPAFLPISLLWILSPMAWIAAAFGPMKVIPAFS